MAEQAAQSFGGLLRQLRTEMMLTQEELAEAAKLSPRSVSDLERGVNRTARKDTAGLLADALGLTGPARELFVAAALGRGRAGDVLAAREGSTPGTGHRAVRWARGCPYRGLLPFGESEAEVFYGRERLAAELAAKAAARASGGGLVVVTGASGSGKSSLLRAGLLPILAQGQQVPGSERWPRIVMMPTKDPVTELAAQLAAVGGPDALAVRDELTRHPDQAHLAVRSAVLAAVARLEEQPPGPGDGAVRLILIVDQFEQVFTLNPDLGGEAIRQAFITALCSAAANPAGPEQVPPALVVLAVRGDFWDRCAAIPDLVSALQDGQFVVGPMTGSELRVAITGPAEAAGLRIEPGLTDTILEDLRAAGRDRSAGVLPLLSQAMALTWDHRDGDRLTSHGYAQAGGVSRAIELSADAVYDELPASGQVLAREILRTMTITSRDARISRRPVTRAALYALPGMEQSQADAILETFAAKRLIVLNESTAEIAHDALLTAWPRLHSWLDEDQASWRLHSQLAVDAEEWRQGRQPDFLYRGIQLADVQAKASIWAADPDRHPALTITEQEFLQASKRADDRRIRQRWATAAALLILLLASLAAAGVAVAAARNASNQRNLAASEELAADSELLDATDLATAAQLAAASWRVRHTAQARASMLELLAQRGTATFYADTNLDGMGVTAIALNRHGSVLATAGGDGTARLWDVATRRQIGAPITAVSDPKINSVTAVAFSPDGTILATGGSDGTARLWDVATRRQIGAPFAAAAAGSVEGVVAVAFSPDGTMLATVGGDGAARLWDVATRRQIGAPIGASAGVTAVAFSPDGTMLATGDDDGTARLWDVATHQQVGLPIGASAGVTAVTFSPDGTMLATGDDDGTARLWNVATHRQIGPPLTVVSLANYLSPVITEIGVAFSPDGTMLATGDDDGTARLWDVATHQQVGAPITAVSNPAVNRVTAVAFSPDGTILATGGSDGTARLWSLDLYGPIGTPISGVTAAAFSPHGMILATGDADGTARLWDVATHQQVGAPITAVSNPAVNRVTAVAFSPDGKILATGGSDDTARLWDVATRRQIGAPITVGSTFSVGGDVAVAFSPDGKILAIAQADGTARLWDVATHRQIGAPIHPDSNSLVTALAFSPDGTIIATAQDRGPARLWDVATHKQIGAPITAVSNPYGINDVAFSPDGSILATAGGDGLVRLWDAVTHQQVGASIDPDVNSGVNALVFSPDGNILATAGMDGTVRLWDVATHQQIGGPITAVNNPLVGGGGPSGVTQVAFSPDGSILATTGEGTERLWDVGFPGDLLRAVCAVAGASLTPQQWNFYIPSEPYQKICQ